MGHRGTGRRRSRIRAWFARESSVEVLRWMLFFLFVLFLIVYGILWLFGRQVPLPSF
jgi:hypothetical protein